MAIYMVSGYSGALAMCWHLCTGQSGSVTGTNGIVNIIAADPIYFVNGVNNTSTSIDYTLYSVGTAATPVPPLPYPPGWYWMEFS